MKPKVFLSILALGIIVSAFGQKQTLELTFTAIDNATHVQLDSIMVMNRSQGGYTMFYYPDTTLTLEITQGDLLLFVGYWAGSPVGVQEINQEMNQFQLFQNYPNPVKEQSTVSLYIPEKGTLNIMVADIQGRVVINDAWQLDEGHHSFRFTPGRGNLFFLIARWNGLSRSIKIISTGDYSGRRCAMEYTGSFNREPPLKVSSIQPRFMQESGILDTPDSNKTYTFQFATNIPCPGTPNVTYEGQDYNTVQIFSQCWIKENLNVGTMIPGNQEMWDNGILEKYCYDDIDTNCNTYGGLYQWNEMMQYTTQQGVQGMCPSGWHLPTDEEWKVLEGAVDSQYWIGDTEWNPCYTTRGFDAGMNLKTTSGWSNNGNGTDLFGFSALPGGYRFDSGDFTHLGGLGHFWTSSGDVSHAFVRSFEGWPGITRDFYKNRYGKSVRCIKDY